MFFISHSVEPLMHLVLLQYPVVMQHNSSSLLGHLYLIFKVGLHTIHSLHPLLLETPMHKLQSIKVSKHVHFIILPLPNCNLPLDMSACFVYFIQYGKFTFEYDVNANINLIACIFTSSILIE